MPVLLIIGQSDRSVFFRRYRFAPVSSALRMTASILNLARPNNFRPPRPGTLELPVDPADQVAMSNVANEGAGASGPKMHQRSPQSH
jgi:hypothetical protein